MLWLLVLHLVQPARAYETDPLAWRGQLPEATAVADAWMTGWLRAAGDEVNARHGCGLDPAQAEAALTRTLGRAAAARIFVPGRGLWAGFGHGNLAAFLEMGAAPLGEPSLYREVGLFDSFILASAGAASTVNLAGVYVGTDKIDHFLATGWVYWRKSREGQDLARALRWGTTSERTFLGKLTSKTFSFADLAANVDGWAFYGTLFSPLGPFQLDEQGCVALRRPFQWEDWVHSGWDELSNPSVYSRRVAARVDASLQADLAAACRAWEAFQRDSGQVDLSTPWYVLGKSPPRTDPYRLGQRCGP